MAAVSNQATHDRDEIRRRSRFALLLTLGAIAVTFAALSLAVTETKATTLQPAALALTEKGLLALAEVCLLSPTSVAGLVDAGSLGDDVVSIKLAAGTCDEETDVTVKIPREQILAAALR